MRCYMVEGDVIAQTKGERAEPLEPKAIFCAGPDADHSTWIRLSALDVRIRLGSSSEGVIPKPELVRALGLIAQHEQWQQDVAKRRGYWAEVRKSQRRQAPAQPQTEAVKAE